MIFAFWPVRLDVGAGLATPALLVSASILKLTITRKATSFHFAFISGVEHCLASLVVTDAAFR